MERGLIHIYCGDGKERRPQYRRAGGQSCGLQKESAFCTFLKNENSGELNILDSISD